MLLFNRPTEPSSFTSDVSAARNKIAAIVARGVNPKSDDFDAVWTHYKSSFAGAQHHKCAFCERKVLGGSDGDVEHFRPKAQVQELLEDPSTWGRQKAHSASLTKRGSPTISDRGYHWLAYEWENFLFSCEICNQKFKRCIFPVKPLPRALPPTMAVYEEPLLLNCYGSVRPSKHLKFNSDGTIEPLAGSTYGFETIRTCGLDREPLRSERQEKARRVHYLLMVMDERSIESRHWKEMINELEGLGADDAVFSGMVRAIVEQHYDIGWENLMSLK